MRVFLCILLSIALIVLDQRSLPAFKKLRENLSLIVLPVQYMVDAPIKVAYWLSDSMSSQHQLLGENARLRAHELLLESKLQKLLALEKENAQLRELLKSSSHVGGKVVVAQLLAVALDPTLQTVIVNRGTKDKVYIGQPVLDAYGVMGQVVSVGLLTSRVMLISDVKSAIPVQDYRNGVRAIAVGMGSSEKLKLINVPATSDIQQGDLFIASGLGLRYPVGYPVGIVSEMHHVPGDRFATIIMRPRAHLNQTQQVLLAWPSNAGLAKIVQKQLKAKLMPE